MRKHPEDVRQKSRIDRGRTQRASTKKQNGDRRRIEADGEQQCDEREAIQGQVLQVGSGESARMWREYNIDTTNVV